MSSSVGMMTFPIYGKKVPNHQPDNINGMIVTHGYTIYIVVHYKSYKWYAVLCTAAMYCHGQGQ